MTSAYLWIFVAAVFFSCQFIFSKLYQRRSDGSLQANLWMVELQGAWIFLIFSVANGFVLKATPQAAVYALFYALSSILSTLASIWAVSMGKLVTVTLYSMIGGQAVPFVYGLLFTGARPTWLELLGFGLVLLSCLPGSLVPTPQRGDLVGRQRSVFLLLCVMVFFSNGLVSVFSDVNAKSPYGAASGHFLVLCALWMLCFGSLLLAWQWRRRRKQGLRGFTALFGGLKGAAEAQRGRALLAVVGIAGAYTALNGLGNVFSLRAAAVPGMQSSVQFPLLNASIMLLTTLWSSLIFREKVSRRDALGLSLLIVGILLFMASYLVYGG